MKLLGGLLKGDHRFYRTVGTFALIFMVYLWVGPKLTKKPAGTPPRSGSNEEKKQVAKVVAGQPPQPADKNAFGFGPGDPAGGVGLMSPTGGSTLPVQMLGASEPSSPPAFTRIANPAQVLPGRRVGWRGGSMPPGLANRSNGRRVAYPITDVHMA